MSLEITLCFVALPALGPKLYCCDDGWQLSLFLLPGGPRWEAVCPKRGEAGVCSLSHKVLRQLMCRMPQTHLSGDKGVFSRWIWTGLGLYFSMYLLRNSCFPPSGAEPQRASLAWGVFPLHKVLQASGQGAIQHQGWAHHVCEVLLQRCCSALPQLL